MKIFTIFIYFAVFSLFDTGANLARIGSSLCYQSDLKNELELLSSVLDSAAKHSLSYLFSKKDAVPSELSWEENWAFLEGLKPSSMEEVKLIQFLQKRWLAKMSGYSQIGLNWVCPCFGVSIQAHPKTSHSYARLPCTNATDAYLSRLKSWKKILPKNAPLILTRSSVVKRYLPKDFSVECLQQEEIGGIIVSKEQYYFLFDWIAYSGLAANRIELDRWPAPSTFDLVEPINCESQIDKRVYHLPSENFMVQGTLKALDGLFASISDPKWIEKMRSPLIFSIVERSLSCIEKELSEVTVNPYHHLEQIHAQISALLEIFSPFEKSDFKDIYQSLLPYKEASFGILASGMSCFTGIINAGPKKPNILYGENTYYECIKVMQKFAASSKLFDEASTQEIKNVDLLALQFNPSLRTDPNIKEYKKEDVHGMINKCLRIKNGSPFTVILDSTFDAIQSQIVNGLIQEFEKEIQQGNLNIICFRSGNKFDLFGMDNYYGAPFFMVNNQDAHWASFQALFTDPILQCDRLSMNWFCLAYKYAAKELQLYQRLIFENTRAFLDDIPEKLLSPTARYRVIPMQEGVDPPFIDIKVTGPLHRMKGCALVAGSLYLSSMEGGYPIFSRPSLGFYHPNFTMIFDEKVTTIRLTLGLDPAHINVLSGWMKTLEKL